MNKDKVYAHSEERRMILINFLSSLRLFFEAGTDELGVNFIMETIGHRSISDIIFEYIKYPVTFEYINVFNIALELLAQISGSNHYKIIERLVKE